jgi:hypothetical protein
MSAGACYAIFTHKLFPPNLTLINTLICVEDRKAIAQRKNTANIHL